ncbi:DUF423 domain-containing protein [Methylobrevis albus]|uniref:DUF423 domain-containing protein n=1 Tax=Methylobrevis albus TaxID=2793297 RepID=A0A931N1H5_9HYPH|nr:DUF423 domain-containing protein [Methylobrevis albus]MBH0239831.1 DUF423 domain-containing protein [Methylobrevis albus]
MPSPSLVDRLLFAAAGLAGAAGVAASAAGAHLDASGRLTTAGGMLLVHAAALAALGAASVLHDPLRRLAGTVLVVGVTLFSGDLALRVLAGTPLFPMAAPGGGMALIAGWILVTISALIGRK